MATLVESENDKFKSHLSENQIIVPSYLHYDGLSGFQDYGIIGFKIKQKIINLWRQCFLVEDEMDEIETPIIMPHCVLKASGHVDRFSDYVVKMLDGTEIRADHLVKTHMKAHSSAYLKEVDSWDSKQLEKYINDNQLTGQQSEVKSKKLMYKLSDNEYMRPELAQGIFVNFGQIFARKNKLPFAVAQIGKSYRNEISPKQFLRLREFTQAEIEYFFDPSETQHLKFKTVSNQQLPLLSAKQQLNGQPIILLSAQQAIDENYLKNEIFSYYLAKIYQFALNIGLSKDKIRFRQHLQNEMAHYSSDCWDLECLIDDDWVECVGCANRQDYDLRSHSQRSSFAIKRKEIESIHYSLKLDIKQLSKTFKTKTATITEYLKTLKYDDPSHLPKTLVITVNDEQFTIENTMYSPLKVIQYKEFYPYVIEPSFGIDRLMYAVLNHNFHLRQEDTNRIVMTLNKNVAPYQVAVFQLSNKEELIEYTLKIKNILKSDGLTCFTDLSSTAIGKRYVRADEIGIPTAITIDFETIKDNAVTVRNRDTKEQIRIPISQLLHTI